MFESTCPFMLKSSFCVRLTGTVKSACCSAVALVFRDSLDLSLPSTLFASALGVVSVLEPPTWRLVASLLG